MKTLLAITLLALGLCIVAISKIHDDLGAVRAEMVNIAADVDIKNQEQDRGIDRMRGIIASVEVAMEAADGSVVVKDLSSLDDDAIDNFEKQLRAKGLSVERNDGVVIIKKESK
jgi:hypothetical protein